MIREIQTLLKVVKSDSEEVNRAKGSHSISDSWFKNVGKSVKNYRDGRENFN